MNKREILVGNSAIEKHFCSMPANKYALLRYRIIDRRIRSRLHPYPGKEDLRRACEEALYGSDGEHISTSTIDKDLWAMRNEGELGFYAPIKFSKEYGGYFYEDPNYTISELPLNDEDLDAIRTAAETLYQFKDIPLFQQFDSAIEKILDRMKINAVDHDQHEHDIIQFERSGNYVGGEHLQSLFKACSDQRGVNLAYQKFGAEEPRHYQFHPYILKEYKNRWYVIGFDPENKKFRTFGLDRISSVSETGASFERKKSFNASRFFKHALGITVTDSEPVSVRLEFSQNFTPYIMSQPIHPTQKVVGHDNGCATIEIEVLETIELVSLILGYGKDVKVLTPNSLRDEVKSALTNCLKSYGNMGGE